MTGNGNDYQLGYDAFGRTVWRWLNRQLFYYVYDGARPIYEYNSDGTRAGWNLYGKGVDEILLRADYVVLSQGQGYFYQQNWQGSVTYLTGFGGEVIEKYRYDAFGQPTTTDTRGIFNNRFKFTGREWNDTFGIYEYRARVYHPGLGRFMSEDPLGFGGGDNNLFRYCGGDPVNWRDATGRAASPNALNVIVNGNEDKSGYRGGLTSSGLGDWRPFDSLTQALLGGGSGSFDGGFSIQFGVTPHPFLQAPPLAAPRPLPPGIGRLGVIYPSGLVTLTSEVKNRGQSNALGLPQNTVIPVYVPGGQNPQGTIDSWTAAAVIAQIAGGEPVETAAFFYEFRPGGPNDFKRTDPIFDAYGNVLYGAAGIGADISGIVLQGAADAWHGWNNDPINRSDIRSGVDAVNGGGVLVVLPPGG